MTHAERDAKLVAAYLEAGDPAALGTLLDLYAPLIVSAVATYVPARLGAPGERGLPYRCAVTDKKEDRDLVEEMDEEVRVELINLLSSYDPGRGETLGAFARLYLRGAARGAFRAARYPDRSDRVWRAYSPVRRAVAELRGALGREPDVHEIADAAGQSTWVVGQVLGNDLAFAGTPQDRPAVDELEDPGVRVGPFESPLYTDSLPFQKRSKLAVLHALKQDDDLEWDDVVQMLRDPDQTPEHWEGLLAELRVQAAAFDTRVPEDWDRIVEFFSTPPPSIDKADAVRQAYSRWLRRVKNGQR